MFLQIEHGHHLVQYKEKPFSIILAGPIDGRHGISYVFKTAMATISFVIRILFVVLNSLTFITSIYIE